MVGRDGLLRDLVARVQEGGSAVLLGPSGIGKTRLLRAVREVFDGAVVAWTGTPSAGHVPLGAVVSAFPELAELTERSIVQVRRELTDHLVELAAGRRLLITVDDAHLLDPVTARGLHEAITGAPWCSVLLSVRPGDDEVPGARTAWEALSCQRLELGRLSASDTEELARAVLGGWVDVALAAEIRARTDGLPLAVVELVRGAIEVGAIRADGGQWRLAGRLPEHPLPELMVGRMQRLEPELRREAELIAHGAPIPVRVASTLLSGGALARLAEGGLVRWLREGDRQRLVMAHPAYGEALRNLTTEDREREVLGALAESFESADPVGPERLRVASWRLVVGGGDAELFEQAARAAYGASDHGSAFRFGRAALSRGGGFHAQLTTGAALLELGRFEQGEECLQEAAAIAADEEEVAWAGIGLAHAAWRARGDTRAALGSLGRLRDRVGAPEVRSDVDAYLAVIAAVTGDVATAREALRRLAAAAPHDRSDRGSLLGRVAAILLADEVPRDPVVVGARGLEARSSPTALRALPLAGELLRVELLLAEATAVRRSQTRHELERALTDSGGDRPAIWLAVTGWLELESGDVAAAESLLRDACSRLEEVDTLRLRPACLTLLAAATVRGGVPTGARELLREVAAERTSTPRVDAWAAIVEAEVVALSVGPEEGAAAAVAAGDRAAGYGLQRSAALGWGLAVRLGRGAPVEQRLRGAATRSGSPRTLALARAAAGQRDGDPAEVRAAARDLATVGARLLGAELAALAALDGAHDADALAAGLLAGCPGARTAALEGVAPVTLSAGLRRVALAAASGESSREIAHRLDRSVRTIDNQLGRVYRQLGVPGRRELRRCYDPARAPLVG